MGVADKYSKTYATIRRLLEENVEKSKAFIQAGLELEADSRRIMAFISKESAIGGLFEAELEEWRALEKKYAQA